MKNETIKTINLELVGEINIVVSEWLEANKRARNLFHGWQQRSVLAGLEHGAMLQIGKLAETHRFTSPDDDRDIQTTGRECYEAYMRGATESAMDLAG